MLHYYEDLLDPVKGFLILMGELGWRVKPNKMGDVCVHVVTQSGVMSGGTAVCAAVVCVTESITQELTRLELIIDQVCRECSLLFRYCPE
jgi:hypothetical protein